MKKGVFSTTLILTAASLRALEVIPGNHTWRVRLPLKRDERAAAAELVAAVRARLGLGEDTINPTPAPRQPDPSELPDPGVEGPLVGTVKSFFRSVCGYFVSGAGQELSSASERLEGTARTDPSVQAPSAEGPEVSSAKRRKEEPRGVGRTALSILRAFLVLVFLACLCLFCNIKVEERPDHDIEVHMPFIQIDHGTTLDTHVQIGYPTPWLTLTTTPLGSTRTVITSEGQRESRGHVFTTSLRSTKAVVNPLTWSWPILAAGVGAVYLSRLLRPRRQETHP